MQYGTPLACSGGYPPATPLAAPVSPPAQQQPASGAARSAASGRHNSRRGCDRHVLVVLAGGMIAFAGGQLLSTPRPVRCA